MPTGSVSTPSASPPRPRASTGARPRSRARPATSAGRDAWVGGSIGPLGPPTRELRHPDEAAIRAAFREQVDGLLEGGVDLFVLETFFDLSHLLLAVEEVRAASDLPVIASMTFGEDLVLADGTSPAEARLSLTRAGVDAIGVNCGVGPQACLEALSQLGAAAEGGPARAIMPNAGLPQRLEGRFVYAAEPPYFGAIVPRLLDAGAQIIGGCCGTTPGHIAAMGAALAAITTADERRASARAAALAGSDGAGQAGSGTGVAPIASTPRAAFADPAGSDAAEGLPATRLGLALTDRRFVISVEIDPPRSIRIDRTLEAARLLRDAGTDVINVSDSAMARVRMGALSVAFGIQHDVDVECIVHTTTRDRNLMALESELLGAHALGVRNILALTGDPPRVGDYPTGTGVWDVDSIGLIEIMTRLNRGEDQAGSPIGHQASFVIACALDPTAHDAATEWDRLERKLAAGAAPRHDPAAVRRGPGGGDVRRGASALRPWRVPRAAAARDPAAGLRAARGVPAQRGPRDHDPGRRSCPHGGGRVRRHRGGHRDGRRAARGGRARGGGHVPDAQLRPLRAGGGARPADPRAPPRGRRRDLIVARRGALSRTIGSTHVPLEDHRATNHS